MNNTESSPGFILCSLNGPLGYNTYVMELETAR